MRVREGGLTHDVGYAAAGQVLLSVLALKQQRGHEGRVFHHGDARF